MQRRKRTFAQMQQDDIPETPRTIYVSDTSSKNNPRNEWMYTKTPSNLAVKRRRTTVLSDDVAEYESEDEDDDLKVNCKPIMPSKIFSTIASKSEMSDYQSSSSSSSAMSAASSATSNLSETNSCSDLSSSDDETESSSSEISTSDFSEEDQEDEDDATSTESSPDPSTIVPPNFNVCHYLPLFLLIPLITLPFLLSSC